MNIYVDSSGYLSWIDRAETEHNVRCALGRGGVGIKTGEGDGVTPGGSFPLRAVLVRTDRVALPETRLAVSKIMEDDGWCDDPASADYNTRISLPHPASHETLSREDGLYDVIVEVGYNDDPVVPGKGSAIFLHVARDDYGPTEGCIALNLDDLRELLKSCDAETQLVIRA